MNTTGIFLGTKILTKILTKIFGSFRVISDKKRSRIFDITGISSGNPFKNSKTACSSHLHPNDSANLYSNPGNVEKKSSHASYPFLDYPFLMHGKSMDQFTFGVPSVRHISI